MILDGPAITRRDGDESRQATMSISLAISAAELYESKGVVCPLVLRKNLFTTAAVDNLDHNPSSTTAQGAFHGTGISLFRNRETEIDGIVRQIPDIQPDRVRKQIPTLPESYTTLTPVTAKQDVVISPTQSTLTCDTELVNTAIEEEAKWQSNTRRLISEGVQNGGDPISWAAFHSYQEPPHDFEVTIGSLLTLLPDDSKSVAMIRHAMDVVLQVVHHLNPGQVRLPVLTLDQPLYAIAKQVQWNWPSGYGEDKFVILT